MELSREKLSEDYSYLNSRLIANPWKPTCANLTAGIHRHGAEETGMRAVNIAEKVDAAAEEVVMGEPAREEGVSAIEEVRDLIRRMQQEIREKAA